MQTVCLCAPKGKWRVVELPTGRLHHTDPRRLVGDCSSEQWARVLANRHNFDADPYSGYTVFNDQGEAIHGPGFYIPFVRSELHNSRGVAEQNPQLAYA